MPTRNWQAITGSLRSLLIWTAILGTWEAAYRLIGWRDLIFPAPSTILAAMSDMLSLSPLHGTRPLVAGPMVSLVRLAVGFAISMVLGGLLGVAMWRSAELDRVFGPLFLGFQTLPSVCWVPMGILVFGLNEQGILFVLVMGSFFAIAIALRDGLKTIPPIYQRAGLMLGATGWKLYRYVLLPASLPAMATSLRQGFSFAWRSLMGAEMLLVVSEHTGLGLILHHGREYGGVSQVVAVMIVMVLIGMAADRLVFAKVQRAVQARFGLGG